MRQNILKDNLFYQLKFLFFCTAISFNCSEIAKLVAKFVTSGIAFVNFTKGIKHEFLLLCSMDLMKNFKTNFDFSDILKVKNKQVIYIAIRKTDAICEFRIQKACEFNTQFKLIRTNFDYLFNQSNLSPFDSACRLCLFVS